MEPAQQVKVLALVAVLAQAGEGVVNPKDLEWVLAATAFARNATPKSNTNAALPATQ